MGSCVSSQSDQELPVRNLETSSKPKKSKGEKRNTLKFAQSSQLLEPSSKYPLPNAKTLGDRLALQHFLFRYIWESNFSAPVDEKLAAGGMRVLDVGCGTGAWVLDMARTYDKNTYTGVDLASQLPQDASEKNVEFQQGEILDGLPFPDNTFDFVTMRSLGWSIQEKYWAEKVVPELVRVTKPGGFIELMEADAQGMNEGPVTQRIMAAVKSNLQAKNVDPLVAAKLPGFLRGAGLADITEEREFCPIGDWSEKIGETALINWQRVLIENRTELADTLNVDDEIFNELMRNFSNEVNLFQTYWATVRVHAIKPMTDA